MRVRERRLDANTGGGGARGVVFGLLSSFLFLLSLFSATTSPNSRQPTFFPSFPTSPTPIKE